MVSRARVVPLAMVSDSVALSMAPMTVCDHTIRTRRRRVLPMNQSSIIKMKSWGVIIDWGTHCVVADDLGTLATGDVVSAHTHTPPHAAQTMAPWANNKINDHGMMVMGGVMGAMGAMAVV